MAHRPHPVSDATAVLGLAACHPIQGLFAQSSLEYSAQGDHQLPGTVCHSALDKRDNVQDLIKYACKGITKMGTAVKTRVQGDDNQLSASLPTLRLFWATSAARKRWRKDATCRATGSFPNRSRWDYF